MDAAQNKSRRMEALGMETMVREYSEADADGLVPGDVVEATRRHFRRFALRLERAPLEGESPDCSKGCSYCCHNRVSAPAHEVLALAERIESMPTQQRTQVTERVKTNADRVANSIATERDVMPMRCALLDEHNACGAYEDRPSNCRRYHSLSVKDCEASFYAPQDLTSKIRLSTPLLVVSVSQYFGFRKLLGEHGLDTTYYELSTALHEALSDPIACRERLLRGDVAFIRALPAADSGPAA